MSEHHHHHVSGKNLFLTIVLNVIITISQVVGGILSGSLALLSDAMHNFSDVLALVIAYGANRLAARPNTQGRTFGYKRAEILATLFNASVLIGIGIFLIIESFHKFYHPEIINSVWVIALGVLSIVLNAVSVLLIKEDAHHNMNIKAAYLHLLTDVMTSVAVVLGGLLMYYFQLYWVDPAVSLLIAAYLIWASVGLVRESSGVLMQFAPKDIELQKVSEEINKIPQISNVHHMHLWQLDDHKIYLEAHLDFTQNLSLEASHEILDFLEESLKKNFGISHTTFQCEYNRCDEKEMIKRSR
ncbi:cation diffusion facilitator family transporter [bacterium]|nr:cation diffusion facilitator family transporter [bacterium]MBU1434676.1 cation diffusion facilitator family transporter [bacterium]MBU1502254.1 cation diffusion facilitator family transporter [bacterium]